MTTRRRDSFDWGFTLLEMLVSLSVSGLIFAGLMRQYSSSAIMARDQKIRIAANLEVQAIVQTMGLELRMLGNGVPFDQANFQIGEDTLLDPTVTEPIQVSTAGANHISFRLNETGNVYLLTQLFVPVNRVVYLTTVEGLNVNDPVYITNSVIGGIDGLYGIIAAVDSGNNSITLAEGYQTHPETVSFGVASVLEEVPLVTYNSPGDGSGITRDSGFGSVLLGAGSTFTLQYLDEDGNTLGTSLTNLMVVEQLRAVRVTVTMPSSERLSDGTIFTARASQTFGIRNLNYAF